MDNEQRFSDGAGQHRHDREDAAAGRRAPLVQPRRVGGEAGQGEGQHGGGPARGVLVAAAVNTIDGPST